MDTEMIIKLREYLKNTSQEQKDKDWAEIKKLGLEGPTVMEILEANAPHLLTK